MNWCGRKTTLIGVRRGAVRILTAGLLFLAATAIVHGESLGAQGGETGPLRRQLWRVPSAVPNLAMRTLVLRPSGPGPFPLMIMNHGSTQSAERRLAMPTPEYRAIAQWFVHRGYVVALPQRPGHGETGGRYLEDQNGCDHADFRTAGERTADSIAAAIAYLTAQPFVRRTGTVVVGQSAGAWGALALASRNPAGLRAVVNFAGGRGGRSYDRADNNCAPERLIDAARDYGAAARVPTLWLYTENDSYFPPRLSRRLYDAFRASGGRAEYRLLPAFGDDGHFLAEADASEAIWAPAVERFLAALR